MTTSLLDAARRHADTHADAYGVAATPIAGLTILRETAPSPLRAAVSKPLVALVLQGAKRVMIGDQLLDYDVGRYFISTVEVPSVGGVRPTSIRIEVDFPAPFGPASGGKGVTR